MSRRLSGTNADAGQLRLSQLSRPGQNAVRFARHSPWAHDGRQRTRWCQLFTSTACPARRICTVASLPEKETTWSPDRPTPAKPATLPRQRPRRPATASRSHLLGDVVPSRLGYVISLHVHKGKSPGNYRDTSSLIHIPSSWLKPMPIPSTVILDMLSTRIARLGPESARTEFTVMTCALQRRQSYLAASRGYGHSASGRRSACTARSPDAAARWCRSRCTAQRMATTASRRSLPQGV
jgi:hypothetical protein